MDKFIVRQKYLADLLKFLFIVCRTTNFVSFKTWKTTTKHYKNI